MEFENFKLDEFSVAESEDYEIGGNIFASPTPGRVMDFSSFGNTLTPPQNVIKPIKKQKFNKRPDISYKKARENLASVHCISAENIIVENSVFALLDLVLRSLKLRNALLLSPCETYYKNVCRLNGCDVKPYVMNARNNFVFDCDEFIDSITSKYDALIISNPNTITGRVIPKSDITAVLDYCQSKGIYVIIDESCMDFVLNPQSVAGCIEEFHNAVVLRSPADYYSLSAIGAVYGTASSEIIEIMRQNRLPWQVDSCGCLLLENAYRSDKFDLKTKKWLFEEKKNFIKLLSQFKQLKILHSDCHYILIKLDDISAATVYSRLLKRNILIRDASSAAGLDGSYIRVTVRDKKSNAVFADELMRCLI